MDFNRQRPKVSVIIPCYNRENFLRETIDSVLGQSYPNTEIIAIDDGSSDSTRKILNSYCPHIKVLQHSGGKNRGQSASINLGLRYSIGEYIALLDSDDLFAPKKIERQVSFLEKNPDIGLVYANGFAINETGEKLYQIYNDDHVETSNPERVLMDCYFLVPNNSLVRRSAFEAAGEFDESLRAGQDHDMAIRLAEVTKIAYLNDNLFYYRRHNDSISASKAVERWQNGFKILYKAFERYDYSSKAIRRRKAVLNFRLGQCFIEEKRLLRALYCFFIAGLLDPVRSIKVLAGIEKITGPH